MLCRMNEELEQLKHGDFIHRFRYFYVTRLRNYWVFRTMRKAVNSDIGSLIVCMIIAIPCVIYLCFVIPYGLWKHRKENRAIDKAMEADYINRDRGWH